MQIDNTQWGNIADCANAVHAKIGYNQLPKLYFDALEAEFIARNVPYKRSVQLKIYEPDSTASSSQNYTAAFICYGYILIKIYSNKANLQGHNREAVRLLLEKTRISAAYLLAFGGSKLRFARVFQEVNSEQLAVDSEQLNREQWNRGHVAVVIRKPRLHPVGNELGLNTPLRITADNGNKTMLPNDNARGGKIRPVASLRAPCFDKV
jgi:GxxExxY protein